MSEPPAKKRRTNISTPANGLPRPAVSEEDISDELSQGNVITVIESHEDKLSLLRYAVGKSIIIQQSMVASGLHTHCVILFVVDDNLSISQYATELENMGFSVGSYTLGMHSSGTNQWPNIIYNDIVVVAANMLLDSLVDGNLTLSQAHLIVFSDAQRVMPMAVPHPVLRIMLEYYAKTQDPPKVLALFAGSIARWATLDLAWLEGSLQARAFFLMTEATDFWFGPLELVIEHEAYTPNQSEPELSNEMRRIDTQGLAFRQHHYRRASRVFLQLGAFAAGLYWREGINAITKAPAPSSSALADIQTSLNAFKNELPEEKLDIDAGSPTYNATPKLAKTLQTLQLSASYGTAFRGIVTG